MSNRRKLNGVTKIAVQKSRFGERVDRIRDSFAGRYNAYLCDKCGKGYLTLDIDHGVTPMLGPCFATEGCDGVASSAGYPEGEPPARLGDPIIHWVKPTKEEIPNLSYSVRDHVARGGLIRKPTETTPEWVREKL